MNKIKKFFEFFDTEDLKSAYEIPYLSGELNKEDFIKNMIDLEKNNDIFKLLKAFGYRFNFLNQSNMEKLNIIAGEHPKGSYQFIFENDKFVIQMIIFDRNFKFADLKDNEYILKIITTDKNIDPSDVMSNMIVAQPNKRYLRNRNGKVVIEDYTDLDINSLLDRIDFILIPLLKTLEFDNILKYHTASKFDAIKN
jgi:hypothetical protein